MRYEHKSLMIIPRYADIGRYYGQWYIFKTGRSGT